MNMPAYVWLAGACFFAGSLSLFVVLVARSMHSSKSDWERWGEDEEQTAWIERRVQKRDP